jgi:mono/diheme cytochrome c family protein
MRYLLLALSLTVASAQSPAPSANGDAQNGKKVFDSYGCYQCHDHDGKGGAGARLAPNPIPFAAFTSYVRQPRGEMPPYTAKVVSNKELADMYAFLQSIPKPPMAKSVRILNN